MKLFDKLATSTATKWLAVASGFLAVYTKSAEGVTGPILIVVFFAAMLLGPIMPLIVGFIVSLIIGRRVVFVIANGILITGILIGILGIILSVS